jgi:prolyl-tRNA editing enzyme YbaK/EbsC (Cys-tRNA(Pro) deacylase)
MLWNDDIDQMQYAQRNGEAVGRGAVIRRLFIIPEGATRSYETIIESQIDAGISVRVASPRLLAEAPELEDCVLFCASHSARAFIAHPTIDGSRRIRSAVLDLSPNGVARQRSVFSEAWQLAAPPRALTESPSVAVAPSAVKGSTPGLQMRPLRLEAPVITCEEAAQARGIPLTNELKTLLLRTSNGMVAAHLPGDGVLSLRKVKVRLESAEAYIADPEELSAIGLSPGTVSAVLDPVWSLPHLVSRRLLNLSEVMTNDGTRTGYFAFDPAVLVEASDVIVGDFEK